MKALVQREVESRIIADLPEIHPDIRKLGIGGEGPPLYYNMDTDTVMILTDRIQIDLDRLFRQVRLEQVSFVSVAEKVKEDNRIRLHLPTIHTRSRTYHEQVRYAQRSDDRFSAHALRGGYSRPAWK
jgi:hypothetical protein